MNRLMRHARGVALGSLLFAAGCQSGPPAWLDVTTTASQMAEPLTKPDVVLTDQSGQPFDFTERTDGRLTLLFFGFTHCPDICPITMGYVAAALDLMEPDLREQVDVVFISVDPDRDTPERLEEWLGLLDPSIIGLTGPIETVGQALGALGYAPPAMSSPPLTDHSEHMETDPDANYEVAHPSGLFVFTPDGLGRFVYLYGFVQPQAVADDVATLLELDW